MSEQTASTTKLLAQAMKISHKQNMLIKKMGVMHNAVQILIKQQEKLFALLEEKNTSEAQQYVPRIIIPLPEREDDDALGS